MVSWLVNNNLELTCKLDNKYSIVKSAPPTGLGNNNLALPN